MTDLPVETVEDAERTAAALLRRGCRAAIVTLGGQGAVYADAGHHCVHVPAPPALEVVDTVVSVDSDKMPSGVRLEASPGGIFPNSITRLVLASG